MTAADRPAGPPDDGGGLVASAERAIRASGVDPRVAREEARRVLDAATARGNAEAASVASRALALAARELGDLPLAESHLREAIRVGAEVPRRLAQARMSLVSVRTERGDPSGALRLADQAEGDLPDEDRAALAVQRAIALVRLGRHGEAVRLCDRALGETGANADPRVRSAALLNRGLALTYLGDHGAGAEDLAACLRIAAEAGLDYVATLAEANLSFNAVRRGDIPAAFAAFTSAERGLAGYPERLAALRGDFAEALVAAHLPGEARALLRQAVPELAAAGALVHLAEARLFLAQVELLAGDPHSALATARLARRELDGQGRHAWIPLADDVVVRARLALEPTARTLLADAVTCADALHHRGWSSAAAALRLTAARLAIDLGEPRAATAQLDQVIALCGPPPPRPADDSLRHDRGPTPVQASPGIRTSPFDATPQDVRTGRKDHNRPPVSTPAPNETSPPAPAPPPHRETPREPSTGPTQAQGRTRPTDPATGPSPSREPAPSLGHALTFHHAVALRRRLAGDRAGALEAVRAGLRTLGGGEASWDIRAHAARPAGELAELGLDLALRGGNGATVLAWAERWRACVRAEAPTVLATDRLREALGDAALIELVRHGDTLAAVTVTRTDCALHRLGSYRAAVEATVRLRYCLRRRGLRDAGAGDGIAREAATLSALLLSPLTRELAGGPVVIVPSGALHTVPWPVLPPLRGRPVCVAPSVAAWLTAGAPRPADAPCPTHGIPALSTASTATAMPTTAWAAAAMPATTVPARASVTAAMPPIPAATPGVLRGVSPPARGVSPTESPLSGKMTGTTGPPPPMPPLLAPPSTTLNRARNPAPGTAADTAPGTALDAVPDTAPHFVPDVVPASMANTGPGTALNAVPDVVADTAPHATPDTALGTATDVVTASTANAGSGTALNTAPGTALNTTPDAVTATASDAGPSTAPDVAPDTPPHAAPSTALDTPPGTVTATASDAGPSAAPDMAPSTAPHATHDTALGTATDVVTASTADTGSGMRGARAATVPGKGPTLMTAGTGPASVVVVAGPGLAHVEAEAAMVLGTHPGAVRVPARTGAVLGALGSADVAHIAAHGVFCAHSPLLSSIALDDGPLMAYDLLRLARAPRLVVLSACDAGMAHTPADGAPLGLAGTFLDRGAACVVASLVPVRDDEALILMTAFHRHLATGAAPAEALAAATETTAVPGFACLGAGWPAAPSPPSQG